MHDSKAQQSTGSLPEPVFGFVDADQKEFRIYLPIVPERLVVVCWDVDPVAGGGTPTKPPKKVEFEVEPRRPKVGRRTVDVRWSCTATRQGPVSPDTGLTPGRAFPGVRHDQEHESTGTKPTDPPSPESGTTPTKPRKQQAAEAGDAEEEEEEEE